MAARSILRIQLDLRKIIPSVHPSLVWLSVDTSLIQTIEDLKSLITKRFSIFGTNDFKLFCQEGYLPSDETIAIVRDEDLIRVQLTPMQEKSDSHSSCFILHAEKECEVPHRKRKLKSNDNAENPCSDNDAKRNKTDVEICGNIEKSWRKKHREKRKKHSKHKFEVSISGSKSVEDVNDTSSCHIINDSSSETTRKKKKHNETTEPAVYKNNPSKISIEENAEPIKNCIHSLEQIAPGDKAKTPDSTDKTSEVATSNGRLSQQERTDRSPGNNCRKKRKRSRNRKSKANGSFTENVSDFDKSFKEVANKMQFETNYLSNLEFPSFVPVNKHVKFTDTGHIVSTNDANSEEKSTIQNDILPLATDGSTCHTIDDPFVAGGSCVTLSPLHSTVENSDSNSTRSRKECFQNSVNVQSKYKTFSKERQLATRNTNLSSIYVNESNSGTLNGENEKLIIYPEKKDYKKFSILKGPPRTGDLIAYKILELSDDYCPQMSDYKEGKVISYNDESDDIEVQLSTTNNKMGTRKGKFDLPDMESDINAVERPVEKNTVIVNWSDMVDPRLLS